MQGLGAGHAGIDEIRGGGGGGYSTYIISIGGLGAY